MIDENLNIKTSINILDENILEFDEVEDMIFRQDIAPCQRPVFKAR
jgi:hypothetical protein